MNLPVTSVLAGVLALYFVALSIRVIAMRRSDRISLGDGGNAMLNRRIRAHANFAEYAPLGILLCALCEVQDAPAAAVIAGAAALGIGRIAHGYALSFTTGSVVARTGGMVLTFTSLSIFAITLLWLGLAT